LTKALEEEPTVAYPTMNANAEVVDCSYAAPEQV
jgi:hypothetical protein